jgi:hypothetical protein
MTVQVEAKTYESTNVRSERVPLPQKKTTHQGGTNLPGSCTTQYLSSLLNRLAGKLVINLEQPLTLVLPLPPLFLLG